MTKLLLLLLVLLSVGQRLDTLAFSAEAQRGNSPIAPSKDNAITNNNDKKNNDGKDNPVVDVAIVGAGPAGLVLAHSLLDRGYSVQILERRSSFRPVGSAVFLHPFAINSVRSLSPTVADNLLEAATQIGTLTVRSTTNTNNNAVFDDFDNAPNVFGAPFVAIKFWDMLQALKKGLPEDIFSFGHAVQGYEELDSSTDENLYDGQVQRVIFTSVEDGVPTTGTLDAGMVIDAGGIRSNIRKQLLPDSRSVPVCKAYMAVVPAEKAAAVMKPNNTNDDNNDGGNDNNMMVDRELSFLVGDADGMTIATLDNGDVWWTYTYFDDDLESSLTQEQLVDRLITLERFPKFVTDLVAVTGEENRIETVIADLPVSWKWGQGKVTLLGDAAHAQLPALGLGCSAAFADIEELCRQIDANGLSPKALRWYERLRMPQTAILQMASRLTFLGARSIGAQK